MIALANCDSQDIDDLFEDYRNIFIPAYSDLVGYIADKPAQISIELENILAHISQNYNPALDSSDKEINLKKAHDHLIRVTLDCYKLMWVEMNYALDTICFDGSKILAINMPEHDFMKRYGEFKESAQEARRKELNSIGNNPLDSLEDYKNATNIGKELIASIDEHKIRKLDSFLVRHKVKEYLIGFSIGLISSGTVALIVL